MSALAFLGLCWGQPAKESKVTIPITQSNEGKGAPAGQPCPAGEDFESAGYTVADSKVDNPFDFLPWVHAKDMAAEEAIGKLVNGKPFRYSTAVSNALDVINQQDFFPSASFLRIKVRIEMVVVYCSEKNLKLVYHVYSSAVTPSTAGTPESQTIQNESPQKTAGLTDDTASMKSYQLTPSAGFDSTNKVHAGGTLNLDLCPSCKFRLQGVAEGQGSQAMSSAHVAIKLSHDLLGAISHFDALLNFNDSSLPTGAGQLHNALGSLQGSATTRPFWGGNVSGRFGGLLEKGSEEALLHIPLPQAVLTATAVNALKLYGGLDSRLNHQVLSASFGLELGTDDVSSGLQWKKYIGDVRHEFWHSLGDRAEIDIDSRFTLGTIQASPGKIPLAERFFGGNYEQAFMPDDSWDIRSNPIIRAIPGLRFYDTPAGPGGNSFKAYNLTIALATWRKPVVPAEVKREPKFMMLLNGQLTSATSIEQLHYLTLDPGYINVVKVVAPQVVSVLNDLKNSAAAAEASHPDQLAKFQTCASAVKLALARATKIATASDASQYGYVATLLKPPTTPGAAGGSEDDNLLTKVVDRCGDLALVVPGAGINVGPVSSAQNDLETSFSHVNQTAAQDKAKSDMVFVRRTLNTLFHDADLFSLGPVAIVDVAEIGPTGPGVSGMRYGPGGGVRLELASTVDFTVGYARNVSPGPGEGSGAVFFSIGMRDLFH
jgi:hypothetical protein